MTGSDLVAVVIKGTPKVKPEEATVVDDAELPVPEEVPNVNPPTELEDDTTFPITPPGGAPNVKPTVDGTEEFVVGPDVEGTTPKMNLEGPDSTDTDGTTGAAPAPKGLSQDTHLAASFLFITKHTLHLAPSAAFAQMFGTDDEDEVATATEAGADDPPPSPKGLSQETHFETFLSFMTRQTLHFFLSVLALLDHIFVEGDSLLV